MLVIDVDFGECNSIWFGVLCCKRFVGWRNGFTRSAPVGIEVGNDDARCGEEFIELGRGFNVDRHLDEFFGMLSSKYQRSCCDVGWAIVLFLVSSNLRLRHIWSSVPPIADQKLGV